MDHYRHQVSGIFAYWEEAGGTLSRRVERRLPRSRLQPFAADSGSAGTNYYRGESNEVLNNALLAGGA